MREEGGQRCKKTKWFDSDQAKDNFMIEEFNKALKTSLKECIQNAVQ